MRPPLQHGRDRQPDRGQALRRHRAVQPDEDRRPASARPARAGPVGEDQLALLAQRVEEQIRSTGAAEIEAHEIGLAILAPLRELDEVAYLRFASVYQAFESLEDFESAITVLRAEREPTGVEPASGERT